jgi:hypothetical protein
VITYAVAHQAQIQALPATDKALLLLAVFLVVAFIIGFLIHVYRKPSQGQAPSTQSLSQGGIVNAPHFEFNPRINIPISQSQSQQQSQQQTLINESAKLDFECVKAKVVDVEIDGHRLEILTRRGGAGPPCKAAIAEFRRNPDDSGISWLDVTAVAELNTPTGEPILIRQGQWLVHEHNKRILKSITFDRLDTKPLAVALAIGSDAKLFTYDGYYVERASGYIQVHFHDFVQQCQELVEPSYDVVIRLMGTKGGKVVFNGTFEFELGHGDTLSDITFRKKAITPQKT